MKTEGYKVQEYHGPVKRYCQTMELKNDPELIAEYVKRHSESEAWPEIRAGIREVGILEMDIYFLGNRLLCIKNVYQENELCFCYCKNEGGK